MLAHLTLDGGRSCCTIVRLGLQPTYPAGAICNQLKGGVTRLRTLYRHSINSRYRYRYA